MIFLVANSENHRSTMFSHEPDVGVECRWKRGWRSSQRLMSGVLCVVEDQVHVEMAGFCYTQLPDAYQEINALLTADRRRRSSDCVRRCGVERSRAGRRRRALARDHCTTLATPTPCRARKQVRMTRARRGDYRKTKPESAAPTPEG